MPLVLLGLWLLASAGPGMAALRSHYFEYLSSADGLAQNTVNAIVQDATGYVWVATQGGLHRYDGQQFLLLQEEPGQSDGLPDSWINALVLGRDGELWVGTYSSYLVQISREGRIRRHRPALPAEADPQRDSVRSLGLADDGTLWVGSSVGVEHYDPRRGQRDLVLQFDSAAAPSRNYLDGISLALDKDGAVWAASAHGLYRIDPATRQARQMSARRDGLALHRDPSGRLWFGSEQGLAEIRGEAVVAVTGFAPGGVRRIGSDPQGGLWLALQDGGVRYFDPASQRSVPLPARRDIPHGLAEPHISAILVDRSGLLWLGGFTRGLAVGPAAGARFPLLLDPQASQQGTTGNNIRALAEDDAGRLWAGVDPDGLWRIETRSGQIDHAFPLLQAALARHNRAGSTRVLGLATGAPGRLWVSTDRGLFDLDWQQQRAELIELPYSPTLRGVVRHPDGSLWIGTNTDGVLRYDPGRQHWRRFAHDPADPTSLSHPLVTSLYVDARQRVWAGTPQGLNWIDPRSGAVHRLMHEPNRSDSLSGPLVRAVQQGADGTLYVATHSGMSILRTPPEAAVARFQRIGKADGLPSNTVYGIQEDAQGRIWLSSNLGLARFDPRSRRIDTYSLRDGLQDLEFNGSADLRLRDGRLAFGGINGINLFDPRRIEPSRFSPPIVLTSLQIGSSEDDAVGLNPLSTLRMHYDDRLLRLRFAALDFAAPLRNRYRYRLEGFDPDWVDLGRSSELSFTSLDPGSYRLAVRATNRDGVWGSEQLNLDLQVVPPWWMTWWARGGALLSLLLAAYAGYRWRIRRIALRQRELAAEVAARTADLTTLAEIGRELTASLDSEAVFDRVRAHLAPVLDAHVFSINLVDREQHRLRSELAVEDGVRLPALSFDLAERNRPGVCCVLEGREIAVGSRDELARCVPGLATVSRGQEMQSVIYVPLQAHGQVIGCLSIQSPRRHAYSEDQRRFVRTLSDYAAIALSNAQTYQRLKLSLEQLQRTQDQLLLSERLAATGQLTAGVAHEINNPTNFAYVAAQNLEEKLRQFRDFLHQLAGSEAAVEVLQAIDQRIAVLQEQLATILEGNRRVARIVQDLRTFSRLDEAERKPVSLVASLRSTLNLVATQYREQIEFVERFEADPQVECVPARMNQVFMNLIVNACHAIVERQRSANTAFRGRLEVSSALVEQALVFAFRDNGSGMSEAVRQQLFEPFFTTKPVGEGSGLGLSVSWGIVQEHGGRIEVESTLGDGSCLRVVLPVDPRAAAPALAAATA